MFLLTDSSVVRNYAERWYTYQLLPYEPKHLGLHKTKDEIAGTVFEFQIMCSADKIYTYSTYDWVSGFAMAAKLIYDVPTINLKRFTLIYQLKQLVSKLR